MWPITNGPIHHCLVRLSVSVGKLGGGPPAVASVQDVHTPQAQAMAAVRGVHTPHPWAMPSVHGSCLQTQAMASVWGPLTPHTQAMGPVPGLLTPQTEAMASVYSLHSPQTQAMASVCGVLCGVSPEFGGVGTIYCPPLRLAIVFFWLSLRSTL